MGKKRSCFCLFIVILAVMLSFVIVTQATPTVSISFYKDNGYGMGGDINGYFTANAAVSEDVIRVEFYLDDELQQNDLTAPFSWSFNTEDYPLGEHTIEVVAYDSANQTASASATRNFVSFPVDFVVIIIVAVIVILIVSLAVAIYRVRKPTGKNATKIWP
ncbi:MAG: Ig-like domain-containing protein [Candidatus Bathyarchaeota archaeon]|nr:Ig-like domain-containing protein [Candidatus Bathyarchaeota archaeon]